MNREIKFRGKVEGQWWHVTPDDDAWAQFWVLVDRKTVGQFTGRKDSKEQEVYEGDTVKATIAPKEDTHYGEDFERGYWIGKVVFQDCGFHIKQTNDKYMPTLTNYCIESLEVIGNAYENPGQGDSHVG